MSKRFFLEAEDDEEDSRERISTKAPLNLISLSQSTKPIKGGHDIPSATSFLLSTPTDLKATSKQQTPVVTQNPESENSKLSRKEKFFNESSDDEFQFSPVKSSKITKPEVSTFKSKRRFSLSESDSDAADSVEGLKLIDSHRKEKSTSARKTLGKVKGRNHLDDVASGSENEKDKDDLEDHHEGPDIDPAIPYDDLMNYNDEYDIRPSFNMDFRQKDQAIPLPSSNVNDLPREINRYISRYLLNHQVEGVKWMWSKLIIGEGAILGDGKFTFLLYCATMLFLEFNSIPC
jgi:hypothetical protein